MRSLPTLYKKTSTGKIQCWDIGVRGDTLVTVFGLADGKKQTAEDVIKEGKNVGRANATTAEEQAEAEALAKWTKQKKKGYVESLDDAEAGKRDALIEGGIDVMLAHPHTKQGHKIAYPAFAQPKLDGIRCIAILKNGKCTLWTRTRKLITGVPHIEKALEQAFPEECHIFDGELYNHEFKYDFEKIVHFVRQETPAEGHEVVQYHIYDYPSDKEFCERHRELFALLSLKSSALLCLVDTHCVNSYKELLDLFEAYLAVGYEGAMVRNTEGKYVGKRSYDLQKVKNMETDEYDIVGVNEGRGKLADHAATFTCRTAENKIFEAKMKGSTGMLKKYWEDHSLWRGKKLTVQFQALTGANGVPRFPVGIAIRDYE